ncbi:potassium voltage-gated channel subfamily E member 4 [Cololabis saira]|uniref:potassium voltage-gated channel subfamily E member 4 n=1 Tax=Cololabis saira TaxID=129043 RepID=UPI002AD42B44|nr:potassium voltage-gated channel subfamily E member 4 [Cololabis saira]
MEHVENSTASSRRVFSQSSAESPAGRDGSAHLYILIVMSFYVVFLCGIMLGYFRSKRREKRRINIFTRLLHEEEQREWGALPKKSSLGTAGPRCAAAGPRCAQVSLPFCAHVRYDGSLPSPLACALCIEQSSVSSLCSSADTRFTIEEEDADGGAPEPPRERAQGGSESSGDNSG